MVNITIAGIGGIAKRHIGALSCIPGVAITLLVLAFNVLGDSLRDRLDPRKQIEKEARR